jgi:hypothetical protein
VTERGFSSTIENALDDTDLAVDLLVYLNWVGGAVRIWTGNKDITWNAQTWTGIGRMGSIDKIADSADGQDIGIELTLNYLDDSLRNEINTGGDPVGRDASVYLALMNTATGQVTDAYEIFPGFIDEVVIEDEGATGRIVVRVASELAREKRSTFYALSNAHQQALFSGDLGMEFASKMDEPILWGRKPVNVGGIPGLNENPPGFPTVPGTYWY